MNRELRLTMARILDPPPIAVWRALSDPDLLARWWGPANRARVVVRAREGAAAP